MFFVPGVIIIAIIYIRVDMQGRENRTATHISQLFDI